MHEKNAWIIDLYIFARCEGFGGNWSQPLVGFPTSYVRMSGCNLLLMDCKLEFYSNFAAGCFKTTDFMDSFLTFKRKVCVSNLYFLLNYNYHIAPMGVLQVYKKHLYCFLFIFMLSFDIVYTHIACVQQNVYFLFLILFCILFLNWKW